MCLCKRSYDKFLRLECQRTPDTLFSLKSVNELVIHNKYALDGYKVNAIDYLLKPISYSDFLTAANKALGWFEIARKATSQNEEKKGIFVKSEYKLIQILFDDILYIESLKDYIKIYLVNEPKPILTLMSMKNMEEMLPSERFIRVHRSFIVQKNKIESVNKNRLIINRRQIPIGETYKQTFMALIENKSDSKD